MPLGIVLSWSFVWRVVRRGGMRSGIVSVASGCTGVLVGGSCVAERALERTCFAVLGVGLEVSGV